MKPSALEEGLEVEADGQHRFFASVGSQFLHAGHAADDGRRVLRGLQRRRARSGLRAVQNLLLCSGIAPAVCNLGRNLDSRGGKVGEDVSTLGSLAPLVQCRDVGLGIAGPTHRREVRRHHAPAVVA